MSDKSLDEIIAEARNNPKQAARIVAIHFFRALRRANFDDKDIINISTEILDCLHQSLIGYKMKVGEEGSDR